MDVAPEWHSDWSRRTCGGEERRCDGGDKACREQAKSEGYVQISLYSLCRKEDLRSEPGTTAYVAAAGAAVALVALGVFFVLRLKKRPRAA